MMTMQIGKATVRIRPFRVLWVVAIAAFAVHTFGLAVLIPMGLVSIDLELRDTP